MSEHQSLFEYVMTYGWVVLLLVILGVALYSLDIFQPAKTKTCLGFNRILYYDHSFSADGKSIILQTGNTKEQICITSISVKDEKGITHEMEPLGNTTSCAEGKEGYLIDTNSKNLIEFSVIGTIGEKDTDYTTIEILVNYDVTEGIPNQVDTATCSGTFN